MKTALLSAWLLSSLLWISLVEKAQPAEPSADLPAVAPRHAPPIPLLAEMRRVRVSNAEELAAAVADARDGDVILLADGIYRVGRFLKLDNVKNVILRGASSDPAKVVLRGRGFDVVSRGDDILRIARCENVTVAHLTFADCHAYGVKVEAEHSPEEHPRLSLPLPEHRHARPERLHRAADGRRGRLGPLLPLRKQQGPARRLAVRRQLHLGDRHDVAGGLDDQRQYVREHQGTQRRRPRGDFRLGPLAAARRRAQPHPPLRPRHRPGQSLGLVELHGGHAARL